MREYKVYLKGSGEIKIQAKYVRFDNGIAVFYSDEEVSLFYIKQWIFIECIESQDEEECEL